MDELTDDEREAVIAAVRKALADDPFPRAPGLDALRSALAKLDPTSAAEPHPAVQAAPCGSYAVTRRAQGEALREAEFFVYLCGMPAHAVNAGLPSCSSLN